MRCLPDFRLRWTEGIRPVNVVAAYRLKLQKRFARFVRASAGRDNPRVRWLAADDGDDISVASIDEVFGR